MGTEEKQDIEILTIMESQQENIPANSLVVSFPTTFIAQQSYTGKYVGTSLSAVQERLMQYSLAMFARAFKGEALEGVKVNFPNIEFSLSKFLDICGCAKINTTAKNAIAIAAEGLSGRFVATRYENPLTKAIITESYTWVQSVKADVERDYCRITVNSIFEPQIREMDKNPSISWMLSSITGMQSKYGPKLFALLNVHRGKQKQVRIDMHTLCEKIDATTYDRPADVRRRVVEPAINDINLYSGVMQVTYEMQKLNKQYWFTFTIVDLESQVLPLEEAESPDSLIKAQIGYHAIHADMLSGKIPTMTHLLNTLISCIADAYTERYQEFYINKSKMPVAKVKEQYKLLGEQEIRFVLETIADKAKKEVKSGAERAYLQTLLFNAPGRLELHQATKNAAMKNQEKPTPCGAAGELGEAELEAIRNLFKDDPQYPYHKNGSDFFGS